VPTSAYLPIAFVTLVCAFSCTGLGMVNAGLGFVVRENAVLSNIMFGVLLVFSGSNVPIDQLPGWMQAVSEVIPFTHGIQAARDLADGEPFSEVAGLVGTEALIGVVYGILGYSLIRAMEVVSRHRATLEVA
jgi:ABC-2 type transport system permease protein